MLTATRLGLGFGSAGVNCFQFSKKNLFNNANTLNQAAQRRAFSSFPSTTRNATPRAIAISRPAPSQSTSRLNTVLTGGLITTVGLGLFTLNSTPVRCESPFQAADSALSGGRNYASNIAPGTVDPPQSSVNVYQLSFGTVCGICAGVFIKKGAKFIAFMLGGIYVLLQYFSSQRLVTVDWSAISKKYDSVVDIAAGPGGKASGFRGSTAQRIWNRGTHFLMADFQPRATFMAGMLLGLRIG